MEFGKKLTLKGTKHQVTLAGKAMVKEDGKITEKYVVEVNPKKMTLKDALPLLKQVVISPDDVEE